MDMERRNCKLEYFAFYYSPGSVVAEFLMTFTVEGNVDLKTEVVVGVMKRAVFGDDQGTLTVKDIVVERKCQLNKTPVHIYVLHNIIINVSIDVLKWRQMHVQMRESMLRQPLHVRVASDTKRFNDSKYPTIK